MTAGILAHLRRLGDQSDRVLIERRTGFAALASLQNHRDIVRARLLERALESRSHCENCDEHADHTCNTYDDHHR